MKNSKRVTKYKEIDRKFTEKHRIHKPIKSTSPKQPRLFVRRVSPISQFKSIDRVIEEKFEFDSKRSSTG